MNTTKATPGLLVCHVTDGGAVYVTDNHDATKATFSVRIDSTQNRNPEAMGKLLAAAPEMLAVLEEDERVIRWAAQESHRRVKAEIVGGWLHHADKTRAAIAKAKVGVK